MVIGVLQRNDEIIVSIQAQAGHGRYALTLQIRVCVGGLRHTPVLLTEPGSHTVVTGLCFAGTVPVPLGAHGPLLYLAGGIPCPVAGAGPVYLSVCGTVVFIPASGVSVQIAAVDARGFAVGILPGGYSLNFTVHDGDTARQNEAGILQYTGKLFLG